MLRLAPEGYYLEKASKVIYDRLGSSVATAKPSDYDWESIFQGVD